MYKARIAATLTHKFGACLALGRVEIDHHYLGAAAGEAKRAGAADAAASDQRKPWLRIPSHTPSKGICISRCQYSQGLIGIRVRFTG
jgi:hypothetical protein